MSSPFPVGRFAPTPSGNLHFGSIVTAVASYLNVKQHQGEWLLRIDNLDPPREIAGAADEIQRTLESLSLHWDRDTIFQSDRFDAYAEIAATLFNNKQAYYCQCSRKQVAASSSVTLDGSMHYPGFCRNKQNTTGALKLNTHDEISTVVKCDIGADLDLSTTSTLGDFVLRRRDALFSYHLATVVDEQLDGVTDIVRGDDLFFSSIRHGYLMHRLNYSLPSFAHIPVVVAEDGQKLSKSRLAPRIEPHEAQQTMYRALIALQQNPPPELAFESCANMLEWATQNWTKKPFAIPSH